MGGFFLLLTALAVVPPQVQVTLLDGSTKVGTVNHLSAGEIKLQTDDGEFSVVTARVLAVTPKTPPPKPGAADKSIAWIELVDGSKFAAIEFTLDQGFAQIQYAPGIAGEPLTTRIATGALRKVRFSAPDDSAAPAWPAGVGADAAADLLAIRKKENVDFLEGVVDKVTADQVVFRVSGELFPVKRARVDGLVFAQKSGTSAPEPICTVDDIRGWRLRVKDFSRSAPQGDETQPKAPAGQDEKSTDPEWLFVTTPAGAALQLPWATVSRIDFSPGKLTYLSDLDPESVQWTPYLDLGNSAPALAQFYAPRRDESREHEPLRLGGKQYDKGLAMTSRTAAVYRVPQGMKKFKATVGIDDSVREVGRVRLEISADGKKLYDRTISGKDAPQELDLDLPAARRLAILVDYGDDSDAGDYLNLAEARMLK